MNMETKMNNNSCLVLLFALIVAIFSRQRCV